jgi:methyl-accepting chemotaxis protein
MAGNPQRSGAPKRRILFIERAFQLKFIAKVTAVAVLGTGLTGGLLYFLADKEFGRAFYSAHYQARSSWELLLPAVLFSSFVSMFLVAAVAVFMTLYDSHRIGGPLYRFKANLETVAKGDLMLVTRLRDGDELQALTEAMNGMTQSLGGLVRAVRDGEGQVADALARLRAAAGGGADAAWAEVGTAQERLRAALRAFRIDE